MYCPYLVKELARLESSLIKILESQSFLGWLFTSILLSLEVEGLLVKITDLEEFVQYTVFSWQPTPIVFQC